MKNYYLHLSLSLLICLLQPSLYQAQINHVPNPGFEDILDCDIQYGEVDKATPWQITGSPNSSPDLYHVCANEDSFYGIPTFGGVGIVPYSGEGMSGLVNLYAEEKIYARLLAPLPTDHDIYLSFAINPEKNYDPEFGTLCYSNTQSLAFNDNLIDFPKVALASDTLLNNGENWTQLETCYQATGEEKYVFLGNYQTGSRRLVYCDNYADINFTYAYVDDVIVAPFDVVPDTIIVCAGEVQEFMIDFFKLPITWEDGFVGGQRTISESGNYTVLAETANCLLRDNVVVIKIPEQEETIEATICDEGETILNTPVQALWDDGTVSTSRIIVRPGTYTAELLIDCEEESVGYIYEVTEVNCGVDAFVPNVFSPNADGLNDEMKFYFNTLFDYSGELIIFDRWGNHLFQTTHNSADPILTWDGRSKGEELNPGVYIWIFRYQSSREVKARYLSGDVTIVK